MIKIIDLFAGIGGFRIAAEQAGKTCATDVKCVFTSEIDQYAQHAYFANFGDIPFGDITKIDAHSIPNHDLLLAGFPCQPFSIIGSKKGFEDIRGTLFFDIARILEAKRPKAFVLENVKLLVNHDQGKTMAKIEEVLTDLGYYFDRKVLNALDFGLPQKRERVFIVGYHKEINYEYPKSGKKQISLEDILEKDVDSKHFASEYITQKRKEKHTSIHTPSIWHENKAGNISSYPYSCALRAGASYNYLLVNGERRLTPREMLRLQGFPESFKIAVTDSQARKQAGNSLPVPMAEAVIENLFQFLIKDLQAKEQNSFLKCNVYGQEKENYYARA
jgi:DNA (cytosine-5)-methyltransferase 1